MRAMLLALSAAAVLAAPAQAQLRGLAVEVRGGASVGNYAVAASDFEVLPQPSFGASVSYAATERIAVYAGYSRSSFGCETGFCADRDVSFTSQGLDAGVRYSLPVIAGPWVSAGIVRHSVDTDSDGTMSASASGFGFSAGAGVELGLGRRLSVTPGVRYVRYGSSDDHGVAMLVGDVGLRIRM
jgi:Outer membrane protein beta-barrel domain